MEKLSEPRIYVGTYAKYNEGSIFGKWMDLSRIIPTGKNFTTLAVNCITTKKTRN